MSTIPLKLQTPRTGKYQTGSCFYREFFSSSQLSQFMDQRTRFAELTHKPASFRHGSAGLSRERGRF